MFLSGTAAPAALQMVTATQRFGQSKNCEDSAYNIARGTAAPFVAACEQQPKLRRQWPAYLQYAMGDRGNSDVEILRLLGCLDRHSGLSVPIVEVSSPFIASTELAADEFRLAS